ncbi:hypothetical protein [Arthrobacter sp. NicSoilB8]|uniref:hypothetical protein n=1 Tax=Arthrobacter sp. NicSoilB8 TaxID=2830998 RepID=UPI001CC6774F|nr:hypothetical protein [Arthrobacter sp. NicSoilB8]BCW73541.1 hypothetical protein NicSoilB8_45850 [Arthrobacter sp. NicSoilB8]
MTGQENYVEHALQVGDRLMGLTLEQLGFVPRLEDLTEDQRSRLDPDDLEWAGSITPERRDRSLFQAKLLAGALWEASAVLIDQLFEDLDGLRDLDRIDRQDIANTFVLSGLPPRHADKYDVRFARQFLVIATDMTGALTRGWARPSCVAQELALRCLFDQVEVIQDLYDLDLADDWRGLLEQHMLEDTDSEMLYQNAMDGFEDDIELNMQLGLAPMKIQDWFEPFNDASVPPYVR